MENEIDKFNRLVAQSYEAARAGGWWNDPETGEPINRNKGELLALVHTELGEAYEAYTCKSMDDKLPHRFGQQVELADAVIRLGDYAGGFGYDVKVFGGRKTDGWGITPGDYAYLHWTLSLITENERKGRHERVEGGLSLLLEDIFTIGTKTGDDFVGAIEEKLAFNAQRQDHKPEARAAADGKKF